MPFLAVHAALRRSIVTCAALILGFPLMAQQSILADAPLFQDGAQPAISEPVAGADALWLGHATTREGGLLAAAPYAILFAASAFEPRWGGRYVEGVDVARGVYAPFEVDLLLPTRGPVWPVARTLAPTTRWQPEGAGAPEVFVSNTDAQGTLSGSLGSRWMLSGTPTITTHTSTTHEYLIMFFGADRHMTFARETGSNTFRGVNGSTGLATVRFEAGVKLVELVASDGHRFTFFAPDVAAAGGQLWRIIGPDGRTAFAGHATSPTLAISTGFDSAGRLVGAVDGAGRAIAYTYGTDGLLRGVRITSAGNPALTLASVEYEYYSTAGLHGSPSELKRVTTRMRTSAGSPQEYQIAATHYRYSQGRLRLELRPDGYRRAVRELGDIDLVTDSQLEPFAWWRFTHQQDGRLLTAQGGGATSRVMLFTYALSPLAQTPEYNAGVKLRTTVATASGASLTSPLRSDEYLFDECGQPLGVVTREPGTSRLWARAITRDSAGRVVRIHEPSNVASVQTGGVIPFTFHADSGVVIRIERITSGELEGFPRAVVRTIGNATGAQRRADLLLTYWSETSPADARVSVGDASLLRVLAHTTTRFRDATALATPSTGQTSVYAYTFQSVQDNLLDGLRIRTITQTPPEVPLTENGLDPSIDTRVRTFFASSGDERLTRTASGRLHYSRFDPVCGREAVHIHDAQIDDPLVASLVSASGFTSSATPQTVLHRRTQTTYDELGRTAESLSHQGLVENTWYAALPDGQAVIIQSPHRTASTFFGPATAAVLSDAGEPVAWGSLAPRFPDSNRILGRVSSSLAPPLTWMNLSTNNPLRAVAGFTTTTMRGRGVFWREQSVDGARTLALRRYHTLATPLVTESDFGVQSSNYDRWTLMWDQYGRRLGHTTPAGTTYRQQLDLFGRPVAQIVEVARAGSMRAHTVRSFEYDGGMAGRNGLLTALIEHPEQGVSSLTRFGYDAWDQLRAMRRPAPPHLLLRSNNHGQTVAIAGLEDLPDWGNSALPTLSEPDAGGLSSRRSLQTREYDARGRMFRETDWRVDQLTGALAANCTSCITTELAGVTTNVIYGPEGSVRGIAGPTNVVNSYNRACELIESVQVVQLDVSSLRGAAFTIDTNLITGRQQHHIDRATGYHDAASHVIAGCADTPVGMMPRFERQGDGTFQLGADPSNGNILGSHSRFFRDQLGRRIGDIDFGVPRSNRGQAFTEEFLRPHDRFHPPTYTPVREFDGVLQDDEPADNQPRISITIRDEFGAPTLIANPAGDVDFRQYDDAGRVTGSGEGSFNGYSEDGRFTTASCSPDQWQQIEYVNDRVERVTDICQGINCGSPPPMQSIEVQYGDQPMPPGPMPVDPVTSHPWEPDAIDNETLVGILPRFERVEEWPDSPDDFRDALGDPPIIFAQRTDALGRVTGTMDRARTLRSVQFDAAGRPLFEYVVPSPITTSRPESKLRSTPMAWSHSYDGMGRRTGTAYLVPNAAGDDWFNQDEWAATYNSASLPLNIYHKHRNFGDTFEMAMEQDWNWTLPNAGTQNYRLSSSIVRSGGFMQSFDYGPPGSRSFHSGRTVGMSVIRGDGASQQTAFHTTMCGSGGITSTGSLTSITLPLLSAQPSPPPANLHTMRLKQQDFDLGMLPDFPATWETGGVNPFGEPARDKITWCAGNNCDPTFPTETLQDVVTQRDGDGSPILGADYRLIVPVYPEGTPLDIEIDETPICAGNPSVIPGGGGASFPAEPHALAAPLPRHTGSLLREPEFWKQSAIGNLELYRRGAPTAPCPTPLLSDCGQQPDHVRLSRTHDGLDRITTQTSRVVPADGAPSEPVTRSFAYDIAGNTVDTGGPYLYEYDLLGRLVAAYHRQAVQGARDTRGAIFARFTYDALGRLRSAAYDTDTADGNLDNEDVDWYAYDDRWRLVAVHRQAFKYREVKLTQRIVYADRGIGAREGGGIGNKLDCPAYVEMDEDFDGVFERRITYAQDRGGNVVAVFDTKHQRRQSPADATPGLHPVRIAYTAFGEPVNVGSHGLGTYLHQGELLSVVDIDFNNDGTHTGDDLVALTHAVDAGSNAYSHNGRRCDPADFNRDGEVNADDVAAFTFAMSGQYRVPAGDIGEYRFLYRGYWYDRHLNIYHVRHRVYDPRIQRWLQPDPAMFVDGLNRYAYCGNRPFGLYDPMGLWSITDYVGLVADGAQEFIDHLSGLTRAQDAAWQASMQMQRSVDQHALHLAYSQLEHLRDQQTRDIIDAAVGVVVIITLPVTAGGSLTIIGGMSQGMMIGISADLVAQIAQMQMGVRGQWDYNRTASAGAWGGAFGGAGSLGSLIGRASASRTLMQSRAGSRSGLLPSNGYLEITVGGERLAGYGPKVPYNRVRAYGHTPTRGDRIAGRTDHQPPLVQRYYEGDSAIGELPGFLQNNVERARSAADRCRLMQPTQPSWQQGNALRPYSDLMRDYYFPSP